MPYNFDIPLIQDSPTTSIPLILVREKAYDNWLDKAPKALSAQAQEQGFSPEGKAVLISRSSEGSVETVYAGVHDKIELYDLAAVADQIKAQLSSKFLETATFSLETKGLKEEEITQALTGWALSAYSFDAYKSEKKQNSPALLWPKGADKKRVLTYVEAITVLRDLINTPANDMGPVELENAAREMVETFKASIDVTDDNNLIKKNFPVIYTVGEAAAKHRRPRLIDIRWGKKKDPKVTLVGKGVCFDTGGLNLKPGQYMKHMKKDMGGAAHVLALAYMIMALKLPIQLRVLIPAVENAVGGAAFRPGDIIKSRKGLFIENTNTDAEGRLVLADSLTYACEDDPELVIDYATLTGSARAALGEDIPAFFATDDKTAKTLQDLSSKIDDPLWSMPLWKPYERHVKNSTGDLVNSVGSPGDLIYSALFLQQFVDEKCEWLHVDTFAWESSGRPGRAKGGSDKGLRAMFAYLEKRYG